MPKAVKDGVGGIVTSLWFSSCGSLVFVFLPKMVGDMASQRCPCLPESHQWSEVAAVQEEGGDASGGACRDLLPTLWCWVWLQSSDPSLPLVLAVLPRQNLPPPHLQLFSRPGL